MLVLFALAACEPMEPSGAVFTPVVQAPAAAAAPAKPDPLFEPSPEFVLSSEQMTGLASASPDTTMPGGLGTPTTAEFAPSPVGVPSDSRFPVRLLSTLPQAQPPRAILGLPSGEEVVVAPGSILAADGLVVLSVSADRVQLARIEAAGDHARIENLEITAQYPAAPAK